MQKPAKPNRRPKRQSPSPRKPQAKRIRPKKRPDARVAILEAAYDLFVQKGLSATTLRDIQKRSGMNSALIKYYFGDKDGLIREVISGVIERTLSQIPPIEIASIKELSQIKDMIRSIPIHMEGGKAYRLLLAAEFENGAGRRQFENELTFPVAKIFGQALQKCKPELSDEAAMALADTAIRFGGLVKSISLLYLPALPVSDAVRAMVSQRLESAIFGPGLEAFLDL